MVEHGNAIASAMDRLARAEYYLGLRVHEPERVGPTWVTLRTWAIQDLRLLGVPLPEGMEKERKHYG